MSCQSDSGSDARGQAAPLSGKASVMRWKGGRMMLRWDTMSFGRKLNRSCGITSGPMPPYAGSAIGRLDQGTAGILHFSEVPLLSWPICGGLLFAIKRLVKGISRLYRHLSDSRYVHVAHLLRLWRYSADVAAAGSGFCLL